MLAKPEYFSPPDEVCCWQGVPMRFLACRGAVAERHREDVAGRGAAAELLAGSAMAKRMAALWRRPIGKMLLAGDPAWKRMRQHREAAESLCRNARFRQAGGETPMQLRQCSNASAETPKQKRRCRNADAETPMQQRHLGTLLHKSNAQRWVLCVPRCARNQVSEQAN